MNVRADMLMFQNMSFWDGMRIPRSKLKSRFEFFFWKKHCRVEDRQEAIKILMNITSTIQKEMVAHLNAESTYGLLLKLYFMFDEVHSLYLTEKEIRAELVEQNINDEAVVEAFTVNRNIERDIIDDCSIEMLRYLGFLYILDERFSSTINSYGDERLSKLVNQAITIYCDNNTSNGN